MGSTLQKNLSEVRLFFLGQKDYCVLEPGLSVWLGWCKTWGASSCTGGAPSLEWIFACCWFCLLLPNSGAITDLEFECNKVVFNYFSFALSAFSFQILNIRMSEWQLKFIGLLRVLNWLPWIRYLLYNSAEGRRCLPSKHTEWLI